GLAFGDSDVFKSASIHASTDLSGWGRNLTQVVHPEKRNVSFRVVEGAIRMTVSKSGTTFILR
ncbi:MAG TPA: hypothetical protein PLJ50_13525, partial [Candidatus Latescibacteria bacterium]|nr:hypothetical protein [Candidatus Latescibacterota bacterium]